MGPNEQQLLEYYKRELTYLRKMGASFGARYPKIAGRLEVGLHPSPDPHIERLIESFAFLTARIQYDIESEFPRLATALLGVLYPQFTQPIPSMSVAQFEVDPSQGKMTTGHLIPRHTPLSAPTLQGHLCRFRTAYDVVLWPLGVTYAGFEATDRYDFLDRRPGVALVLRLRLACLTGSMKELALDRARFHLAGERILVNALYELLFAHTLAVVLLPEGDRKKPVFLPETALRPVGFEPNEAILPYPPNAHDGYRLLQEYFTFPEKFLFFDLDHLDRNQSENHFDVLICLDQIPSSRLTIDEDNFRLGCAPIVNLFPRATDPLRLNEQRFEYLLHPDKRRESHTEIHSIRSVSALPDPRDRSRDLQPFFSYTHEMEDETAQGGQFAHPSFWYATRRPTGRKELSGAHVYLSFVDLDFNPRMPAVTTIYAHTLCTNRGLAEQLPAGARLMIEQAAPLARIAALTRPTDQVTPPLSGASLWRLISHLSLNYLSLSNQKGSIEALREILRLYGFSSAEDTSQQIMGIREMATQLVTRRVGREAWRGFCRGVEVTLAFDEQFHVGTSAFLLAAVLNRFFPLYASVNSFTQLTIKSLQREGVWKQWPPVVGEQFLL
jgi:type VI secretion system protein ImpG